GIVTMTEPTQPAPTPGPTTPPPPPTPATQEPTTTSDKVFTQAEVTALATREKQQGRQEALREITERLGCTVEEAEQMLKDARDRENEQLTEAERKLKAAEAREAKAAEREAKAAEREHRL